LALKDNGFQDTRTFVITIFQENVAEKLERYKIIHFIYVVDKVLNILINIK